MKKPEFTTCEQYVLAKLTETEAENQRLREELTALSDTAQAQDATIRKQVELFHEVMEILKPDFRRSTTDDQVYINFDSIWQKYDQTAFERFLELTGLTVPEIPVNNTEEEN